MYSSLTVDRWRRLRVGVQLAERRRRDVAAAAAAAAAADVGKESAKLKSFGAFSVFARVRGRRDL